MMMQGRWMLLPPSHTSGGRRRAGGSGHDQSWAPQALPAAPALARDACSPQSACHAAFRTLPLRGLANASSPDRAPAGLQAPTPGSPHV